MDAQQQLSYYDFHVFYKDFNFIVREGIIRYLIDESEIGKATDRTCSIIGTCKIDKWIIFNLYFVIDKPEDIEEKMKRFSLILSGEHPYIQIIPKKNRK